MPEASFGQRLNLPSGGGIFLKLKSKGDKIKFAIANTPHYETLHWVGDKEKVLCGKYNGEDKDAYCKYCEEHKTLLDAGKKDQAKKIAPVSTFYYPIVNLSIDGDPQPAVFQFTAKSIHYTISGYTDDDVDVFACLWSVERTEEQGNYYAVRNLGPLKLSDKAKDALARAKEIKLKAVKESSSVVMDDETFPPEE